MTLFPFVGYLILFGLAVAFIFLGVKGFSAAGLPLSKRSTLKGRPAQAVGGFLLLCGASIVGAGLWDFFAALVPQQVGPARAIEPAPMPPVADIKPMVQPPKNRHVGAGGIFSDISDKWTGNLSISSG